MIFVVVGCYAKETGGASAVVGVHVQVVVGAGYEEEIGFADEL